MSLILQIPFTTFVLGIFESEILRIPTSYANFQRTLDGEMKRLRALGLGLGVTEKIS